MPDPTLTQLLQWGIESEQMLLAAQQRITELEAEVEALKNPPQPEES